MKNLMTLAEYLNSKGNVESGTVDISGDKTDPMTPPTKPPKDQGHRPYSNSDGKAIHDKKAGFGDQGDKDLCVKFDTGGEGKSGKSHTVITAENFNCHELVPLITSTLAENPSLIENIIRDIKRNGLMPLLVGEMMDHKETYEQIAELMGNDNHGEEVCNKFVRAMREETAVAYHKQHEDEDEAETAYESDYPNLNGDTSDGAGLEEPELGRVEIGDELPPPEEAVENPLQQQGKAMFNFQKAMMSAF